MAEKFSLVGEVEKLAAGCPAMEGFTVRDEANAIVAYCFRNGPLEDLHAGKSSAMLDDAKYSRITDEEMKRLMLDASWKVARLLNSRERDPEKYWRFIRGYARIYCRDWERSPLHL